jgi:hypothetical protein
MRQRADDRSRRGLALWHSATKTSGLSAGAVPGVARGDGDGTEDVAVEVIEAPRRHPKLVDRALRPAGTRARGGICAHLGRRWDFSATSCGRLSCRSGGHGLELPPHPGTVRR